MNDYSTFIYVDLSTNIDFYLCLCSFIYDNNCFIYLFE